MVGLLLAPSMAAQAATVRIEVANVRATTGRVHVDICTAGEFLKTCSHAAEAPAKIGVTVVTVTGVSPGTYAAQASYDQNGNGKVDRGLFGIPKEGVGFSNDAPIHMGPPAFPAAAFDVTAPATTIRLRLRYFSGPDAPR